MKRYAVFGGMIYYASGGFNDFFESFDTEKEAVEAAIAKFEDIEMWWHVVDMETYRTVAKSENEAYSQ